MTPPDSQVSNALMKRTLAAVLLCLLLATPAWAGMDEAKAAYKRGDFATALSEFRSLAERGNATAQYELGLMYDVGLEIPQDYAEAVKWYRKAAAQGYAKAQFNLGSMYANGRGVRRNDHEAAEWFRKWEKHRKGK